MEPALVTSAVGGTGVLAVGGEVDLATIPRLRDALVRLVGDHRGATVAVDLDGVGVLDDSGLGVILGAAGRAREAGGDLVVVCSDARLRARLRLTGLDRAVEVRASLHG
jgi:anti-sigma B factor antagonist